MLSKRKVFLKGQWLFKHASYVWRHAEAQIMPSSGSVLAAHLGTSLLQGFIKLRGIADKRACVCCAMQQQHWGQRLSPLYTL